jgi:hypothetical protein
MTRAGDARQIAEESSCNGLAALRSGGAGSSGTSISSKHSRGIVGCGPDDRARLLELQDALVPHAEALAT